MSDAYLDNGYGEKIIRAFAEKQELKFWEKTYQNLDSMDKKKYTINKTRVVSKDNTF